MSRLAIAASGVLAVGITATIVDQIGREKIAPGDLHARYAHVRCELAGVPAKDGVTISGFKNTGPIGRAIMAQAATEVGFWDKMAEVAGTKCAEVKAGGEYTAHVDAEPVLAELNARTDELLAKAGF